MNTKQLITGSPKEGFYPVINPDSSGGACIIEIASTGNSLVAGTYEKVKAAFEANQPIYVKFYNGLVNRVIQISDNGNYINIVISSISKISDYRINNNDTWSNPNDVTYLKPTDVLTKTNTANYTPTANFHPATKKYVDSHAPLEVVNIGDLVNFFKDKNLNTYYDVTDVINQIFGSVDDFIDNRLNRIYYNITAPMTANNNIFGSNRTGLYYFGNFYPNATGILVVNIILNFKEDKIVEGKKIQYQTIVNGDGKRVLSNNGLYVEHVIVTNIELLIIELRKHTIAPVDITDFIISNFKSIDNFKSIASSTYFYRKNNIPVTKTITSTGYHLSTMYAYEQDHNNESGFYFEHFDIIFDDDTVKGYKPNTFHLRFNEGNNKALNGNAQYVQFLPCNNDVEYTPTNNYHPATKKYVDDTLANVGNNYGYIRATMFAPNNVTNGNISESIVNQIINIINKNIPLYVGISVNSFNVVNYYNDHINGHIYLSYFNNTNVNGVNKFVNCTMDIDIENLKYNSSYKDI